MVRIINNYYDFTSPDLACAGLTGARCVAQYVIDLIKFTFKQASTLTQLEMDHVGTSYEYLLRHL